MMNHVSKNIETMKLETAEHIEADAVTQGDYWKWTYHNSVEGHGCFIGCLTHSEDAANVTERFGVPEMTVRICEQIFERLNHEEAIKFFGDVSDAIGCDGKDLSNVHWLFAKGLLETLIEVDSDLRDVIDATVDGLIGLTIGKKWESSVVTRNDALVAGLSSHTSTSSVVAGVIEAYHTSDATVLTYAIDHFFDAMGDTDINSTTLLRNQRDNILRLLKEAPMETQI